MTTDGTRIRRALDNLHDAAANSNPLGLTDKETAALAEFVTEITTERDEARATIAIIDAALFDAGNDAGSAPLRTIGPTIETVRWLIDDWRIERSANELDRAQTTDNPRLAALNDARKILPLDPTTGDLLTVADWLLDETKTEATTT